MKKFLLNVFSFVAFTTAFYILFIVLFGNFAPSFLKKNLNFKTGSTGFMYTRLREADTTKNIDILFLGSSHAYRGYDPGIFQQSGYKVFNLGSSAQTPVQTEILADKYLEQLNPKIVIFDVYPEVFSIDGVESALNLISNGEIDNRILKMAVKINNMKAYNSIIYKLFRQLFKSDKNYKELVVKGTDTYIKGGYVQTYYSGEKEIIKKAVASYNILPEQFKAFKRVVGILKKRGIAYYLIQTPVTRERYQSLNRNNKEMDSLFNLYGRYYNFNNILSMPDSCFLDNHHLNQYGVNIFNKKLIDILNLNKNRNNVFEK